MDQVQPSSDQLPEYDDEIPDIEKMTEALKFDDEKLQTLKLVHTDSTERELLKSFRELRTRLLKKTKGRNFVCLVTSVSVGGGGSYVARNLASVITMDKTKTALLVDCNLYAPSAEQLLPKEPALGLTDFLDNERVSVEHILCASGYTDRMVIIDGPSVGEYDAEIRILADLCDFAVIVVPDNAVTEAQLNEAITSIGKDKIAGLVLDKVAP